MKKASRFLNEIITDRLRQRRFIYHTLFNKWSEIIGEDISARTIPTRMKFSHKSTSAVLTIRINSGSGPEMQLQAENIRERINDFFGRLTVEKLKFEMSCDYSLVGGANETETEKNEANNEEIINIKLEKEGECLINTLDPELKALLQSFQKNWFYRRQKCNK